MRVGLEPERGSVLVLLCSEFLPRERTGGGNCVVDASDGETSVGR